jgi:hypothetical protein
VAQNWELLAALLTILVLSAAYVAAAHVTPMDAGSRANHWVGILGFVLMIATETLYSWRKTKHDARWGRTHIWLKAHIFGGIVGPYMVLLHTGFRFGGLAGITFWMTVALVCSGFVGRYIYATVPHTPAGEELDLEQIEAAIRDTETRLQAWAWRSAHTAQLRAVNEAIAVTPIRRERGFSAVLSQALAQRQYRDRWQGVIEHLDAPLDEEARTLGTLLDYRRTLERQAGTAAPARRLLGIWHATHVPLGIATFAAALVHMVAALYFS